MGAKSSHIQRKDDAMRNILLMIAAVGLLGSVTVMAHDADPVVIDLVLGDDFFIEHEDDDPWKGTVTVTANNTGTEAWGNFHLRIFDPMGQGNYTDVIFGTDGGVYPQMNGATMPPYDPWVGYGYEIVTTFEGYSQIDLYYHNMPVNPGESVTFVVYTDNTAGQHSFFGMMMWPSAVGVAVDDATLSGVKALFR
jgi:hypothetical protein